MTWFGGGWWAKVESFGSGECWYWHETSSLTMVRLGHVIALRGFALDLDETPGQDGRDTYRGLPRLFCFEFAL